MSAANESNGGLMRERDATKLVTLYRPIGQREMDLIRSSGFRSFPPRLPHQPIFYPVLTEQYAIQIARDWNTKDAASGYIGYVTRFQVPDAFISQFPVQKVGGSEALEYWIPAETLHGFNSNIIGLIEVIHVFRPQA